MLVLTRRVGEEIVLDENIRVTVLEIAGNKIRLGVTAPDNVGVFRQEVFERITAAAPRQPRPPPTRRVSCAGMGAGGPRGPPRGAPPRRAPAGVEERSPAASRLPDGVSS